LVNFFLNIACKEMGVAQKEISESAIKELTTKDWTGNIRELKNIIERLVILSGSKIEKEDVQKYA